MSENKYRIILKPYSGDPCYVEAFNDDGTPKVGPKNLAMQVGFNMAVSLAEQIRVAAPQWRDITISEVVD